MRSYNVYEHPTGDLGHLVGYPMHDGVITDGRVSYAWAAQWTSAYHPNRAQLAKFRREHAQFRLSKSHEAPMERIATPHAL